MAVIQLKRVVACDFCGRNQHDVAVMIVGPAAADPSRTPAICDECIGMCAEIVAEQRAKKAQPAAQEVGNA